METTRDRARKFIEQRNIKEALKLCRGFDRIYNKSEIRILQIAYECYTGKSDFYRSLGINVAQNIKESINLLKRIMPSAYVMNTKKQK